MKAVSLSSQHTVEFTAVAAIDWRTDERRRGDLLAQKRGLEASADHLAELRHQLDEVTQQHRERQQERDDITATITTLDNTITRYQQQRSACQVTLQAASPADISTYVAQMNARYAMELFKQLDLQLLVLTPLDKIHVIEPYITVCHYVTNNQEENDSKVYNFTMSEYFEHKQALQVGVGIGDYTR